MTLFRKLFFSYLLVIVLALGISAGFAGYMSWRAGGAGQLQQLEGFGTDLAEQLKDQEWTSRQLRAVQGSMDTIERGSDTHAWFVDRNGMVLVASRNASPRPGQVMEVDEMPQVLSGERVFMRPTFRSRPNAPMLGFPVYRQGKVQGAVLMSPSLTAVRVARGAILRFLFYGALAATAVLAVVSFYVSRTVARPLEQLSAAARRIAKGDFESRVVWKSKDEVGRLAEAFNEMTEELNRLEVARKELMATVSHELKGPLARVSGYLEAIHDGIGGEEGRTRHFVIVRREVGRLTRLVNDLLDFSRLEAGRLKLHPIPCDLAPNLTRAAEVFESPARQAGVRYSVSIPAVLPIVSAEPERMEQVLANLVENALAHTPRDGAVSVTAREQAAGLCVEVKDTGPGISPDELPAVWERFYKLNPARTPDRGGFGLGLTIVKQLVELQGGEVFAASTPGEGSTFGFILPLARPE